MAVRFKSDAERAEFDAKVQRSVAMVRRKILTEFFQELSERQLLSGKRVGDAGDNDCQELGRLFLTVAAEYQEPNGVEE